LSQPLLDFFGSAFSYADHCLNGFDFTITCQNHFIFVGECVQQDTILVFLLLASAFLLGIYLGQLLFFGKLLPGFSRSFAFNHDTLLVERFVTFLCILWGNAVTITDLPMLIDPLVELAGVQGWN
jgi:hypothetical protein